MYSVSNPNLSSRSRALSCALLLIVGLSSPITSISAQAVSGQITVTAPKGDGTPCNMSFSDVSSADYYYDAVHYLYCMGAINGYPDGTFRPNSNTTRAQVTKIIVSAKSWPLQNPLVPSFSDVPRDNSFYQYIETARVHNIIGGYSDGTFLPNANITRSQLTKVVSLTQGWALENPPTPTFSDVAPGTPFYIYIETAARRGVVSGYSDGMFRPGNPATRGQISKIIYTATTPLPPQITPEEQQTMDIINQRRASLGLNSLRVDITLIRAAHRHSNDIGPLGLCQHNGTDGSSPWDRIAQAGYTGQALGEVVGCNFNSPQSVVEGWWASPTHYAILVDPAATDIGCGWWLKPDGYGWQTCDTGTSTH